MQLDRRSIVRDDFPRARRGYDPDEVRNHLKQLAELVEELEQDRRMSPVADSAASQVRSILQAAEHSRTKLESAAQKEADQIREEAERIRAEAEAEAEGVRALAEAEADQTRRQAMVETAERMEEAHEASKRILDRAKAIERELATLQSESAALGEAVLPERPKDPEAEMRVPDGDGAPSEAEPDAASTAAGSDASPMAGVEDIRLIALNMALNGSSRSETAAYLRNNFGIEDPEELLDGVYAEART